MNDKRLLFGFASLLAPFLWLSCGSVEVKESHFYRLAPVPLEGKEGPSLKRLRVEDFSLSPHLKGGRLIAVDGNRVRPYRYQLWTAPLDQLVTDTVLRCLLASRRFAAVLDLRDRANADLAVSGRVLRFEQVQREGASYGVVHLSLALREERSGRLLWQGRIVDGVQAAGSDPAMGVEALNLALSNVLEKFSAIAEKEANLGVAGSPGK